MAKNSFVAEVAFKNNFSKSLRKLFKSTCDWHAQVRVLNMLLAEHSAKLRSKTKWEIVLLFLEILSPAASN